MGIQHAVAAGLFRHHLGGFKDYPLKRDARFIEVLAEVSLTAEHAQAICLKFEERMPTLREIRDTAYDLKPKFEPPSKSQEEQWREQYGPPDPEWSARLIGDYDRQRNIILWESVRDALYYTEGPGAGTGSRWGERLESSKRRHPVEIETVRSEVRDKGWPAVMADGWSASMPIVKRDKPAGPRKFQVITAEDVARAEAEHRQKKADAGAAVELAEREPGDGE